MEYKTTLTETEDKALSYASVSQQEWIDNAVHNRCRIAIDEIVDIYTKRALDEGVQIPATRELIVTDAFTRSWVKTAQQRNEEAESQQPDGGK
tara:strand:+ start:137 stop:415 length:279 start_codon:yes stop_codon:yes gene_type:complete